MRRLACLLASSVWFCTVAAIELPARDAKPAPANAALVGIWTLNTDLSDKPPSPDDNAQGRGRSGGRGGGGQRGHGGFGGGGVGRGTRPAGDPSATSDEERQRRLQALRDLLLPSKRLTVITTETMVIVTGDEGRTTRLVADGSKIKEESTKSERRTRWVDGSLVSEISGLGRSTITETYSVDPDPQRLRVAIKMEVPNAPEHDRVRTLTHVYDRDTTAGLK